MPKGHSIDAVWIGCGDNRLRIKRHYFFEKLGLLHVDGPLTPPGGALALLFPALDPSGYNLWQMQVYAGLHNPKALGIEVHYDCGAVKKLLGKTFKDETEEHKFLVFQLEEAKRILQEKFPEQKIVGIISTPGKDGSEAAFEQIF